MSGYRLEIDPNVRVHGYLTYAAIEHDHEWVSKANPNRLRVGDTCTALEPEGGAEWPAIVVEISRPAEAHHTAHTPNKAFIYLAVARRESATCQNSGV